MRNVFLSRPANGLAAEVLEDLSGDKPPKTQIVTGTLHSIDGDYSLMKLVMVNLISNAVKYSSKKEQPVIEISSETEPGFVVYTVRDNGAGFDMAYAGKLFGVFQRLHRSTEFEGTGIGLATVQRIITRHGGTIKADSEPGAGATFSFKIPVTSESQNVREQRGPAYSKSRFSELHSSEQA